MEFGFKVCRICSAPHTVAELASIFEPNGKLAETFEKITGIEISIEKNKNDVMLCHDCSRDLKQSFIMRSRARKADEQYFNIERKKTSPKQEPTGTSKVVATNTESSKSPAQCKICLKVFPTSKRLAVHTKVVHMKEVHACERCDKKYSSKGNLKRHKLIHIKMSKDESGQNKSQEGPTGESCAARKTKNRLKSSSKDAGLKDPKVKLRRSKPKDEPAEERCATRKSSKRLKPIIKSPSGDEKSDLRPFVCSCGKSYTQQHGLKRHQKEKKCG